MRQKYFTALKSILALFILIGILELRCGCNPTDYEDLIEPSVTVYLNSPDNGELIYAQDLLFRWSVDNHNVHMDTIIFRIRPNSASTFTETLIEYDYPYMTNTIDTLEPSTVYYWNVYGAGYSILDTTHTRYSDFSETRSFTMADQLYESGDFYNPSPDSDATNIGLNPNISCAIFNPDSIMYQFDLYFGETLDPPLLVSNLDAPSYNIDEDTLDYITSYYWRYEAYSSVDTLTSPLWKFTTEYPPDVNVFTLIEIDAYQSPSGYHVLEETRARIDTGLAIVEPILPLQADSVKIENTRLDWQPGTQSYSFTEMSMPFIENGTSVEINIYGNEFVSNLSTNVIFPACTLAITSPESFENVPISGFEVTWDGSECGGSVILALLDETDSTGVFKELANDGIDSLTATDLLPLDGHTGVYDLYLIKQVETNLLSSGYKPQSKIRCRTINRMLQIYISSR